MLELLLASYLGLQATDTVQTLHAIQSGLYYEANPIMAPLVEHPAAFIAVKAAASAGTMYAIHRLKQQHPKAALWTTIGVTVGMSWVVVHNARQ